MKITIFFLMSLISISFFSFAQEASYEDTEDTYQDSDEYYYYEDSDEIIEDTEEEAEVIEDTDKTVENTETEIAVETPPLPRLVSQKIPSMEFEISTMMEQLQDTIWFATDMRQDQDLYVFFKDNSYGGIAISQGLAPQAPQRMYPAKFVQAGNMPNTAIFLIASQDNILYYSIKLISPFFLVISAGYPYPEPLVDMATEDYFLNGYLLQLVY